MRVAEITDDDLDALADIATNAYPGMKVFNDEDKRKWKERVKKHTDEDPTVHLYGIWRDDQLVGGMRLFDFTMNMFGRRVPVGGVGMVAVDLLHKKEQIAKELISYFIQHYQAAGAPVVSLYAFRHDFYKRMGFGYGTKMSQYRLQPGNLPRGTGKRHLAYLGPDDALQLHACYARVFERTHGHFERSEHATRGMLENQESRKVGYKDGSEIRGYLVWSFKPVKPDNMFLNDMEVHELVYETPEALGELLTFLQTQADQIHAIVLNTQDEYFHHLPLDPRDGSDNIYVLNHETNLQGLGIMYRVIDTRGIWNHLGGHRFGNQTCRMKLTVADSFFPQNAGSMIVHVADGTARVTQDGAYDVEIKLDVAEFSSLLMGAVRFKNLHSYGLAEISDRGYLDVVNRIFMLEEPPVCLTRF